MCCKLCPECDSGRARQVAELVAAGADPCESYDPCPTCQVARENKAAALSAGVPTRWDALAELTPALLLVAMVLLLAAAVGS